MPFEIKTDAETTPNLVRLRVVPPETFTYPQPVDNAVEEPEPVAPEGKVYLFSLDGTDYFLPEKVGPNVSFRYLRDLRKHGPEMAVAGLFVALLGEDVLDALADAEDLTEEDVEAVMKAVQKHALGTTEGGRGKSSRARRK